jgi:hypothetical protein
MAWKTDTIGRKEIRMRGCLLAVVLVAVTIAPFSAAAQEAARVPAPFASKLRAEPADYRVKLSWHDSPDTAGSYLVYRASAAITAANLRSATLVGTVDSGVQYFVDTPPDGGWFYALLLKAPDGTLYSQLIPFRNVTSAPVSPAASAPEEALAARITGITAAVTSSGDAVQVSFANSNLSRDLLLFRGTTPLLEPEDLLRSVSVTQLDPGTTRYTLPALSGVDYWFAVIDAGLYKIGQAPLVKGANTMAEPVQVPMAAGRVSLAPPTLARRSLPLPSLQIGFGVQTGTPLPGGRDPGSPAEKKIAAETEKSIEALLHEVPHPPARQLRPQVLPSDATPMPGGELGRLAEIVTGPFLGGDVTGAQKQLLDFLSLPRKPEVAARARFYLGQTYYVEGRQRDALLEFLVAQDFYYQETRPWLEGCLDALVKADQ